ncbi:MAG: fibronectin type III domain-containing protein [Bdellovibrio sp.]|nr:MAG: fibronectin type III domain-containing protein [Bdellovibrio sp.]
MKKFIVLLLVLVFSSACELSEDAKKKIGDVFDDPPLHDTPDLVYPNKPFCFLEKHIQPQAEISKSIDILFMVDSSGSLREERKSIGEGIDAFLQALPQDIDARIGVMLAHARTLSGRLYRYDKNKPLVLDTNTLSIDEIRSTLKSRMANVVTERETDGGEMGMFSLSRALDEDRLMENQAEGFFREDAALAVVFVADENDICARYPEGVTPVYDPNHKEPAAFKKYCTDVTAETVLEKVQKFKGKLPLLISGIIYNEDSQFPHRGENEIGYGYLKMIELAGGVAIDLAGGQFNQGLENIGTLATKKLNLKTEFPLERDDFEKDTLKVFVDGQAVPFTYKDTINQVNLTDYAGVENSEVTISYCLPDPTMPSPQDPLSISVFRVVSVKSASAVLFVVTSQPTSVQIEISTPKNGATFYSTPTSGLNTEHMITLNQLDPNTEYVVRAIAVNEGGEAIKSKSLTFRTPIDNGSGGLTF